MSQLVQDLDYARRVFLRRPTSTLVALLTLTVAIGVNTAVYSVVQSLIITPLPFHAPDEVVDIGLVSEATRYRGRSGQTTPYGVYRAWRANAKSVTGAAAFELSRPVLGGDGAPERISVVGVESEAWPLLGVSPEVGRHWDEADVAADPPVMLSFGFWSSRYGRDSDVVGKTLVLDGRSRRIVGVMPEEFRFPLLPPGIMNDDVELWVPLATVVPATEGGAISDQARVWIVGRTAPSVAPSQVAVELDRISTATGGFEAADPWRFAQVTPLQDFVVGSVRGHLLLLLAATFVVLVIACANTANLLLARATERRTEFLLRRSLGAMRGRLVRQLLTESLALTVIAGIAGIVLAVVGVPLLVGLADSELPQIRTATIDGRVLAVMLGVTVVFGVLMGLASAAAVLRARTQRVDLSRSVGLDRSRRRLADGLVMVQVAMAVILLAGSGVLLRSFVKVVRTDLGFEYRGVLAAEVVLPKDRYATPDGQLAFAAAVEAAVRDVGGVVNVAVATGSPMHRSSFSVLNVPGTSTRLGSEPAWLVAASREYFDVLGIPLLRGGSLDPATPAGVLVDSEVSSDFLGGADPIGTDLAWQRDRRRGVVRGVVGSVRQDRPQDRRPHIYMPLEAGVSSRLVVLARTQGRPSDYSAAVAEAIASVDALLPVERVAPMETLLGDSVKRERFYTIVLGVFALTALLIASAGIFATVNAIVTNSVREMGIRSALGAPRARVLALVLRRSLVLSLVGGLTGIVMAVGATRPLEGLLYQVSPADPLTFALVLGVLLFASLLAALIPGLRAANVSPASALRAG